MPPTTSAPTPTPSLPATANIRLSGNVIYRFSPEHVEIARGGTVTWNWVAGIHNVVGDGPIDHPEVVNEAGYSYTVTFPQAGAYAFSCEVHPDDMNGTVTVR
jgi:plastocyanin